MTFPAQPLESFLCEDPYGHGHHLYVEIADGAESSGSPIELFVWWTPNPVLGIAPCYYARFAREGCLLRSDMLHNFDNPLAMHIGLSEAVFDFVQRRFTRTIRSSIGLAKSTYERQLELGRRMWQRFEHSGRAIYETTDDRFTFVATPDRARATGASATRGSSKPP